MRTGDSGRSVASRIFAVFEAFEDHGPLLSLTQIAECSGLPISTTHRIVAELQEWGALARDAHGRYQVGLRLWELAQNASRRLREASRPFIQDLFSLTGETAHLAIREGNEVLYVDRIYGSKRVPKASRIGGRLPLHATAVGKVLLAGEEQWFKDAYLAGELVSLTPYTHVDPVALAAELDEIADQGFAVAGEEARTGACSIAVPMLVGRGSVPNIVDAAIGLVCPLDQWSSLTNHLPALQGIARRIEQNFQPRLGSLGVTSDDPSRFR
ncbi:IclR family transcriptional regulator [Leucobacter sp. GX0328]